MNKIKIGIIGCGSISKHHIKAYLANDEVELYALCDIDEKRLAHIGEKYGIERRYTDYNDLLALPELDAVSVCTWNSTHASITIAALKAGKHVLCEKPMATNLEDARLMEQTAKETGKLLMIGFVRRFGNDIKMIRDLGSEGAFGEFYYAKASYIRRNGNPGGWFGDKARSGGGPLIDLGVHVIDFVRYAMGNPKPVSAYGVTFQKLFDRKNIKTPKAYVSASSRPDDVCDVEDMASAIIRFENGAALHVETAFSLNVKTNETSLRLFGTKGGVTVGDKLEICTETAGYLADTTIVADAALKFDTIFENELRHFADCILGRAECMTPAEDGVELMKILTAVYKSAETGRDVVIE